MKDLTAFSIEIPVNDPEAMEKFQEAMDLLHDATTKYIHNLAKELSVSHSCASDVWYLRTRSRWSEENERELIRLHREGNPPNICEWP